MEVDIAALLGPNGIYLIIFLALLVVLIIILSLINRNLEEKVIIKEKEKEKENKLLKDIQILKASKKTPEIALDSINSIARNFFAENFNISKGLDYSEIMDFFQEKKDKRAMSFCKEMLEALYSGEKINEIKINILIENLEDLIEEVSPRIKIMRDKLLLEPIEIAKKPLLIEKEKPQIQEPAKPLLIPIKLDVAPVIKPMHHSILKPIEVMPKKAQVSEIENKFEKRNEEQIREAYKELQKKYEQAYNMAEKNNLRENKEKLNNFREEISKVIEEYEKDDMKIVELAQEISKGARLLRLTGNL